MTLKARCFEEAAQARKTLRKGNCECAHLCESRAVKLEVHEINLRTSAIFFALPLVLIKRENGMESTTGSVERRVTSVVRKRLQI